MSMGAGPVLHVQHVRSGAILVSGAKSRIRRAWPYPIAALIGPAQISAATTA